MISSFTKYDSNMRSYLEKLDCDKIKPTRQVLGSG